MFIYQNCAPTSPFLRRGRSVCDQRELRHGSTFSSPSVKLTYSNRLWEYRRIFHGKSL